MSNNENWFKKRKYLHFDQPISLKKATSLVKSPEKVSKHPFFPFISFTITTYKFKKIKETNKLERVPKPRPISYAAHIDSHIYSYYASILSDKYEMRLKELGLADNILAFRRFNDKKCNIQFAKIAFDEIASRESCGVVCFDVTKFFDNLDHNTLKIAWCNLLGTSRLPDDHFNVYKSVTKYAQVDKIELYKLLSIPISNPPKNRYRICEIDEFRDKVRESGIIKSYSLKKGIPQGSPISALLSNIYMTDFDLFAKREIDIVGGKYLRYCDDILCIVPIDKMEAIQDILSSKIKEYHLELHPEKTDKRIFTTNTSGRLQSKKPLQYLGFLFDGERVVLRNAALSRYSERMKASVYQYGKAKLKKDKKRVERGLSPTSFYKKKLYRKYSPMGRQNFVRYGYRSAKIFNSIAIKKQLRPLWVRLNDRIEKENDKIGNNLLKDLKNK